MKTIKTIAFLTSFSLSALVMADKKVANLTDPLNDAVWDCSVWLSVTDAPVITGTVNDGTRAADGANWFVSDIKNEKKVVNAKWMTAGLGVYDLYTSYQFCKL